MKHLLNNLRYRLAVFISSPWVDIARSRQKEIGRLRAIIDEKQQSIDQLITLLHSTEAARDLYQVELADVEAELVQSRAALTRQFFTDKEID
jgi:hypothetical protein